jgi:hypothetical protein
VLAFSTEARAREFMAASGFEAAEIAALARDDKASMAALIGSVKRRAIRHILLDLDYHTGLCTQVEFDGEGLGTASQRRLEPRAGSQ